VKLRLHFWFTLDAFPLREEPAWSSPTRHFARRACDPGNNPLHEKQSQGIGAIQLAKSLLRANAGGVYQIAEGSLLAWTRPLIEFLRDFRAGTTSVPHGAPRMLNKRSTTDYSRISYDALRKIADNDAISDHMSDEEYEPLSVEL
jgi:hypothetical protein